MKHVNSKGFNDNTRIRKKRSEREQIINTKINKKERNDAYSLHKGNFNILSWYIYQLKFIVCKIVEVNCWRMSLCWSIHFVSVNGSTICYCLVLTYM